MILVLSFFVKKWKSYELKHLFTALSAVTTDNKEIWNLWGFVLDSEHQVHFLLLKPSQILWPISQLDIFKLFGVFFLVLTLMNVILPGCFLADTEQEVQSWGWSPTFCTKSSLFQGTGGSCWRGCFQLLRCFASAQRRKKEPYSLMLTWAKYLELSIKHT